MIRLFYRVARYRSRGKYLPILIYHRVLSKADHFRPSEPTVEQFAKQMQFIQNNFEVLPLAEAVEQLKRDELSDRAISITFDDGYKDNYENAAPILNKLGLTATFFIATGFVSCGRMWNDTILDAIKLTNENVVDLSDYGLGEFSLMNREKRPQIAKKIIRGLKYRSLRTRIKLSEHLASRLKVDLSNDYMMNDGDIQSLHELGMEIGAHTVNHPILLNEPSESVKKELFGSKNYLEQLLGHRVTTFAYPNGRFDTDYDETTSALVKEAGFTCAVSTDTGVNSYSDDLYRLKRFTPWNKGVFKYAVRLLQNIYG